jgi:tRNA(Ile)-lysidine synthase
MRALDASLAPWLTRLEGLEGVTAPVVVACSGGTDSLALLALAAAAGLDPVAVHVDHGVRPGSGRDAPEVARAAAGWGARCRSVQVRVEPGGNLEARARDVRYAALERARVEAGAEVVLVAHTADDQAETVLLNLLRGSASAGLGAMAVRRGRVVRPLLGLRRADTAEICHRLAVAPVVDPMNADLSYRRVWLRREVIPALERSAGRDLVAVLARQASILRAESDLLDQLARDALAAAGGTEPRGAAVAALTPALARRVVRSWLGAPPPSLDEVERVLAVARGERRATELAGGRRVGRRAGILRVDAAPTHHVSSLTVPFPGQVEGLGVRLEAWVERDAPARWPDGRWVCVLDAQAAGRAGRLERAGDAVVLFDGRGELLWTLGYRVKPPARVGHRTRRFLWVAARGSEELSPGGDRHQTGRAAGA